MQSVFSAQALKRAMRAGDSHRFDLDVRSDGPALSETIAEAVNNRTIDLSVFTLGTARGKPCVTYPSYERTLVLRILAKYLARRFRITPPNRDRIVSGVVQAMLDGTPYTVIRRDVSRFYESIDADALRTKLVYDTSLPRVVRHLLLQYFNTHCSPEQPGLPRGVGLSGILAELAMDSFDRFVRGLPGVYRYFRYSDDIVIFCYDHSSDVVAKITDALPAGMQFHVKKRSETDFTSKDPLTKYFDYLGYRFLTRSGVSRRARKIEVTIAPEKIARMKTKLILSLKRFMKDSNSDDLLDRLRVLTSNYQLRRQGVSHWGDRKRVRSGIYYNYRRCGIYDEKLFISKEPEELGMLDNFTHHLLKSRHSEFSERLRGRLQAHHLEQIDRQSFRLGFKSKRMVKLSSDRIARAREAWRNV